jgi:hypothetical protein
MPGAGKDQPATVTNAAVREDPIARIIAAEIRSKKRASDMTHTFELEPGEPRRFYLSSVKITHI